jgi:hypothetical protein
MRALERDAPVSPDASVLRGESDIALLSDSLPARSVQ